MWSRNKFFFLIFITHIKWGRENERERREKWIKWLNNWLEIAIIKQTEDYLFCSIFKKVLVLSFQRNGVNDDFGYGGISMKCGYYLNRWSHCSLNQRTKESSTHCKIRFFFSKISFHVNFVQKKIYAFFSFHSCSTLAAHVKDFAPMCIYCTNLWI